MSKVGGSVQRGLKSYRKPNDNSFIDNIHAPSTPCWRVIVRVVPPTSLNNLPSGEQTEQALEVEDGTIICNNYENGGEIKYSLGLDEMYKFYFDSIFGPGTNQIDLFSYLEEYVDKAFNRPEMLLFSSWAVRVQAASIHY